MNSISKQRDTPTRSPFAKSIAPRSPTKTHKQELGLSLEHVIGTTCQSATRFDIDAESSSFAYVAGAAVVLATVDNDLQIAQRFFRASAFQSTVTRPSHANGPSTPSALTQEMRSRLGHRTREGSPFTGGPAQDVADSPGGSSGHAKDRVKAATAVALSWGGKWLAVGETGYKPRVLIFPVTEKKSTEIPSAIISEHSFGVHAVAFDAECRFLASLGTINDGFLHIWELDQRTGATSLLASNKCTSLIKQMAWVGRSLITVGTRFIKVWRPDEVSPSSGHEQDQQSRALSDPGFKPLVGRNSLLGDMLEVTFTAIVPISRTEAVICSDAGDVILLDDSNKQQRLTRISVQSFSITAACLSEAGSVIVTGSNGETQTVNIEPFNRSDTPISRAGTPVARRLEQKARVFQVAIGSLGRVLVTTDTQHDIRLLQFDDGRDSRDATVLHTIASHADAILGIRSTSDSHSACAFATWSSDGKVIGWSADGQSRIQLTIPLEQVNDAYDLTNELKTIAFFPDTPLIITGDRYGVLRVINTEDGSAVLNIRAHSNDITDVRVCRRQGCLYIATASRDRTAQVFEWKDNNLDLLQTLDEHAGAVTQVTFADDGKYLMTSSADRTVVVRELLDGEAGQAAIYAIARTVTLKSAPTSMDLGARADQIVVSTADRCINLVNFQTGKVVSTFKTGDNDGGDAVSLSSLTQLDFGAGAPAIAGVCSTDKSIRIYSEDGTLLARDWGHTEGVTGIASIKTTNSDGNSSEHKLVSTAADGTIFIWSTQSRRPLPAPSSRPEDVITASAPSNSPLARPPLRKVISHSEMSRLRRSMISPPPPEDPEPATPSGLKSPPPNALRKRPSRLSMGQAPRLQPSTPGQSTPTEGSPTTARSPSPSRFARSPSRSPERPSLGLRRQSSRGDVRLDTGAHSLSIRPALSRAGSADPSKEPEGKHVTKATSAQEVAEMVKQYRSQLEEDESKEAGEDESALRSELEALLRLLGKRSIGPDERRGTDGTVDTTAGSGAEEPAGAVLESVEEASELDVRPVAATAS